MTRIPVKLTAGWLNEPQLQHLLSILTSEGAVARLVGGAVRDGLLGLPVNDIDIAINIAPQEVIELLTKHGIQVIPTGIKHGTVTALINKIAYQITTLRIDVKTFGRHAQVAYTDDWVEDAARRDFTINALYADAEGQIFDYFGGLDDLRQHRVRFIGEPVKRIQEDYLRILRFFRFSQRFGKGNFDESGLLACAKFARQISILSKERITEEFFKLMLLPQPSLALRHMKETGVLDQIVHTQGTLDSFNRFCDLEGALNLPSHLLGRLSVLKPKHVNEHLFLSKKQGEVFSFLVGFREEITDHNLPLLTYIYGKDKILGRILLQGVYHFERGEASFDDLVKTLQKWKKQLEGWKKPMFPLKGRDIVHKGVEEGEKVGILLKKVEDWWIRQHFRPNRKACLDYLDRLLANP